MYKSPLILDSVTHAEYKIAPLARYDFAKELNSCVLLGQELGEAAKCYPVLFSRTGEEELIAVAILGIKENLFVSGEGAWEKGSYLPAYVRRYPYLLAEGLSGEGSLTVCIDADYPGFGKTEGEPLFGADGSPGPVLGHAVDYLKLYQFQYGITKEFLAKLSELDLLKAVDATITLAGGEKFTMGDLLSVDEEALLKLPDGELAGLARGGYLPWIYAQLSSLTNFNNIVTRAEHVVSQQEG